MISLRTRCPHCKRKMDAGQRIHPACIDGYADAEAAKAARKAIKQAQAAAKVERINDRERREAGKSLRTLLAEAQEACNAYIRKRDAGKPCICCGMPFEPMKPGGSVDAGHFRARSVAPQLRFNEDNIFAQRKNCNRPGGTTYAAFRAGVVERIGEARVLAIEADNTLHKWTRDEARSIRDHYRQKAKDLP